MKLRDIFFNAIVPRGLEYSIDRKNWFKLTKELLENNPIYFNDDLWLRGKNPYGTIEKYVIDRGNFGVKTTIEGYAINFKTSADLTLSGDIRTLIDWENYQTCDTSKACFCGLFYGCRQLIDAS